MATTDGNPTRAEAGAEVAAGSRAVAIEAPPPKVKRGRGRWIVALLFMAPALVLLGAMVLYPIFFSILTSLYGRTGETYVGIDNYKEIFTNARTLNAIKNNAIWLLVAPTIVTTLGLIFAVLTERIRWATAFKVVVFMPMAISFLAAGVIWRLVYLDEPQRGLLNAAVSGVSDVFRPPGDYPGARPSQEDALQPTADDALLSSSTFGPGDTASFGLIAIPRDRLPDQASPASQPSPVSGGIAGTVWLDFTFGGGGERGAIDPTEEGLPSVKVEALDGDEVVASAVTGNDGSFVLEDLAGGSYRLRLANSNFRTAFGGFTWLGPTLVTPAVIASFIWIWAGFAMVVIGAGLAAIPRDVLEAARVDGATEWQVFRRVTVPLLMPVLLVVLVTLSINVLKIFDLVLVIPPQSSQDDATVVALEMWRVAFGGSPNEGLGSALAVFLFLLVIPAMLFNFRRFRAENM